MNLSMESLAVAQLAEVARQVQVMIELVRADTPCPQLLQAGTSARHALSRVAFTLLAAELDQCLTGAAKCDDAACRVRQVARLADLYKVLASI